jgi:hypothetical protein
MPLMGPQAQAMISEAFQSTTYVQNLVDVQHTPIYDQLVFTATQVVGQATTAFFTNVGPASGKSIGQTNMTQSQRLPAPQVFSIFGFRLLWNAEIFLTDLQNMLNNLCLEFYIGDKAYQRAPLWYFQAGAGITGFSDRTAQSAFTNGQTGRNNMHKLAIPIVVDSGATFYAQMNGTAQTLTTAALGGTGSIFTLLLDGLFARQVQ